MPVAFDAISTTTGSATGSTGGATMSWSHTATGSNLVVLAAITCWKSSGIAVSGTRSCSYGGNAMTSIGTRSYADGTGYIEVFAILAPPTGAQTVTWGNNQSSSSTDFIGKSVSYSGVGSLGTPVVATASNSTPSVTVPSQVVDMVAAFFQSRANFSAPTQTQRYLTNTSPRMLIQDAPGAASVTLAATVSAASWAAIGVDLISASNNWTGDSATTIGFSSTAGGGVSTSGAATTSITANHTAAGTRGVASGATTSIVATSTAAGSRNTLGMATTTIVLTSVADGAAGSAANTTITFTSTADGTVGRGGGATSTFGFSSTAAGAVKATGMASTTIVFAPNTSGIRKTTGGAQTTIAFTSTAKGVSGDVGGALTTIAFTSQANGTTDGPPGTVRLTFSWIDADGGTPPWVHISLIPDARGSAVSAGGSVSPTPVDIYSTTGAGSRNIEPGDYRCKVTFGDPDALRYDGAGWINYQPITVDADEVDLREALEGTLT